MIPVAEAIETILGRVTAIDATPVELSFAVGGVLAKTISSTRELPAFSNSAMDGYAVRSADVPGTLPVAGTVACGDPPTANLDAGTTQKIMTGAPLPEGADAVIMREDVTEKAGRAVLPAADVGQHVRHAGEDVAIGDEVLRKGMIIGPGELGLCAAIGLAEVDLARRPSVGVLSTGDELIGVDAEPKPGQVINSNSYALAAQVLEAGGNPLHLGIAPDDRDAIAAKLRTGIEADVLLTSGGVSAGDYDLVLDCCKQLDIEIVFWKVAVKPGKPLLFGVAKSGALVFGLPGNPVSSAVTFELFVRPALLAMQGAARIHRPRAPVRLSRPYTKKPGRTHFLRARVTREGGTLTAEPHGKQGSGMISSLVDVDALVEVPAEVDSVEPGKPLSALLLRAV